MDRPFSTPPTHRVATPEGVLEAWTDRPGWLLSRIEGRLDLQQADEIVRACDAAARLRDRVRFVHDWRRMTGFDVGAPPKMIAWVAANRRAVEHATIVTVSPMVAMAARAVNLTLKNILQIATDETELERALARR